MSRVVLRCFILRDKTEARKLFQTSNGRWGNGKPYSRGSGLLWALISSLPMQRTGIFPAPLLVQECKQKCPLLSFCSPWLSGAGRHSECCSVQNKTEPGTVTSRPEKLLDSFLNLFSQSPFLKQAATSSWIPACQAWLQVWPQQNPSITSPGVNLSRCL